MSEQLLKDIYHVKQFDANQIQGSETLGKINEKDKFIAAKQILLGLAILYVITLLAYVINPEENEKLLDICMTTFPPLATLILAAYFRDKAH